ncbi:MAG: restriction endonuclease [Pseudomonadota bacterium]
MFGYEANFSLALKTEWPQFIVQGKPRVTQNRFGEIIRVYIPITHSVLDLFKEISGTDEFTLQKKLDQLLVGWDRRYQSHLDKLVAEDGKGSAEALVDDAKGRIHELERVLQATLGVDDSVDWVSLMVNPSFQTSRFDKPKPAPPDVPPEPELIIPDFVPPEYSIPNFVEPRITFVQRLLGQSKKRLREARHRWERENLEARAKHDEEVQRRQVEHNAQAEALKASHQTKLEHHKRELERLFADQRRQVDKWQDEKSAWEGEQKRLETQEHDRAQAHNMRIESLKEQWLRGEPQAVVEHACLVLDASQYPDWFQGSYRFNYDQSSKLGMVEFLLPAPKVVELPKAARFVAKTGEITTTNIAKTEQKRLYDELCYQVALRTVHELFEADAPENLNSILFNGVVDQINPATGKEERPTIMSGMFEREAFLDVDLSRVEPKACFKSFKGVSAASLIGLAPVAPIMEISKEDDRFIESRDLVTNVDAEMNLAAMDWEEFEHLVREIFSKEFELRGGEVKVTQSSSDGGVDAVAFDPDPISGGKIVVQAKRYTRTVGVSAVRDLYGTVLNEGAGKGVLVTTADYGPDAYKFAADKPLTLLNGANLLFMLEKHGVNAKIDIAAARKELGLAS